MFISNESAQAIVNEMKTLLGYNINIMNDEGRIIASTNPERIGQLHEGAKQLVEQKMDRLVVENESALKNTRPGINFPIVINDKIVGVIGVTGVPSEVLTPGNVIKRMTELMVESLQQKESQMMINSSRSRFLNSWIEWDGSNIEEFYNRGKLLGIDTTPKQSVVCVDFGGSKLYFNDPDNSLKPDQILSKVAVSSGFPGPELYCYSDDYFVFLIPESTNEQALKIAGMFQREVAVHTKKMVFIGISSHSGTSSEIAILFREARSACEIAKRSDGRSIQIYSRTDPEFIAGSISEDIRVALMNSVLGTCRKERRSEYIELLHYYFQYNGVLNDAAAAMFIHRNTFQYRIDKMEKEIGYRLNNSRDRFILYLVSIWADKNGGTIHQD